jgi:hypothetical protein
MVYVFLILGLMFATIAILPAKYDPTIRLVQWWRNKNK